MLLHKYDIGFVKRKPAKACLQITLAFSCFYLFFFSGCKMASNQYRKNGTIAKDDKLSSVEMKEDLDCLTQVVASSHPDLDFLKTEKKFSKTRKNCYNKIQQELTLKGFYGTLNPVLRALKDDHTMIYQPKGICPKQQQNYAKAIYQDIKERETISNNTYAVIEDKKICIFKFNTCGSPNEYEAYKAYFKQLFREIDLKEVTTLIIDIRNNQGGYSGNSSELLRYIATKPFRQYESATRKISSESLDFYNNCDINLLKMLEKDFDTSALRVSDQGNLKPGLYTTKAKYVYPVHEDLRFKGNTYVLIGPNVFSSGMLFANTVQEYKIAPLIGKKIKWRFSKEHLGDVIIKTLPNSHLNFMVSTTIFTVKKAQGNPTCIVPDYDIKTGFGDSKNKDRTLEYAIKLAEENL